jgi:hypothetical protein
LNIGGFDLGALLGGLTAAPGANADVNIIVAGYKDVEKQLAEYDGAIKALNNGTTAAAATSFLSKSQAVTSALKSATANIKKAKAFQDLFASIELTGPGDSLTNLLESTIQDLVEKKPVLVKAGVSGDILKELKAQKDATTAFTSAINSKLPFLAQLVASGTSQRPIVALESG